MEKRTFLAIILSIFVLFAYQGLVGDKFSNKNKNNIVESQTAVIKEVIENNAVKETSFSTQESEQIKKNISEKTITIENEKLLAVFSNIGGSLKQIEIKDKEVLPVTNIFQIQENKDLPFEIIENKENKISYKLISGEYEYVNSYDLSKQNYLVRQVITIKNISRMSNVKNFSFNVLQINSSLIKEKKDNENGLYEYSIASGMKVFRKSNAYKFSNKEAKSQSEKVKWVGFRDKFYCAIFKPEFDAVGYKIDPVSETKLNLLVDPKSISLNPGEQISLSSVYYFGPQDQDILKKYDLGDFVVFSQFGLLDMISKFIIEIVKFIHKFVPSYGLCLIIVSILIYGAMYPLTMSGMMSMRKMQALQPKMAKLKEQYKNNPQKMNQEVMNLYKENSINPFGGCLPFILQMPVFIALYQALWRSVIFQGQGFLWIKDLAMPDRLFILPNKLPLIGNEINILPLLMMVAMFFQQKLSTKNMVVSDPTQAMQQKMMAWFFPIFLGVLFYKFASGLNLYFTVFYTLSTLTQLKMSKIKIVENE
ncbi:MAG: membrane protein insertase YidC [Candidatus Omnitrophota bacterium]